MIYICSLENSKNLSQWEGLSQTHNPLPLFGSTLPDLEGRSSWFSNKPTTVKPFHSQSITQLKQLSCQWQFQEPIDCRYLPYIRPIFEAYVRDIPANIPTTYCLIWYSTSICWILKFPLIMKPIHQPGRCHLRRRPGGIVGHLTEVQVFVAEGQVAPYWAQPTNFRGSFVLEYIAMVNT